MKYWLFIACKYSYHDVENKRERDTRLDNFDELGKVKAFWNNQVIWKVLLENLHSQNYDNCRKSAFWPFKE